MTVARRRSTGTKGVPREEREEQILAAAAAEFGARGHAGGAIERIAAAAGISRAMVHSYFATKDALYATCVRRAGEPLVAAVAAAQTATYPQRRGQDTVRAILTALADRRDDWTILYDATVAPGTPMHEVGRGYRRELARLGTTGTAEVLGRAGDHDPDDADLFGRMWLAMVSTVVRWWLDHPEEAPESAAERFGRIVASLG
jgi:AcrR family transcriptional regulator